MAEKDSLNSQADNKQPQECSESLNEDRKGGGKDMSPSLCINHVKNFFDEGLQLLIGAAVWLESRRKWLEGDQTQRSEKVLKDPIISWSTSYEDLLLTNEPFSEPIPLAEMVDFLVDVWHMEGLCD